MPTRYRPTPTSSMKLGLVPVVVVVDVGVVEVVVDVVVVEAVEHAVVVEVVVVAGDVADDWFLTGIKCR